MQTPQSDEASGSDNRAARNWALLALPWLAAQRDMLAFCKNYIKDENSMLPMQNFALRQFYALMMVFDPARKWRNTSSDFESGLANLCKDSLPKLISGSVALIEAQEAMLGSMIDALSKMKNAPGKAKQDGS